MMRYFAILSTERYAAFYNELRPSIEMQRASWPSSCCDLERRYLIKEVSDAR